MVLPLYSDTYWFPNGALAVNTPAVVFPINSNAPASLFSDAAGTIPLPNPLPTDAFGVLTFYAAAGSYWIHIDTESFDVTIPPPAAGPFLPLSGGTITGNLGLVTGSFAVDVAQALSTTMSTGVLSGGAMTGLGTSTVTFAPMTGFVVDVDTNPAAPVVTIVNMPMTIHPLAGAELTRTVNWWLCDAAGVITSQATRPTDAQRRDKIQLGVTGSTIGPGVLFNVQTTPPILRQPIEQLNDLYYGLGPFSTMGNLVSANGANLNINKSAGEVFAPNFAYTTTPKSPHRVISPAETPMTFRNSTRLAASQGPLTTTVDVANYDVAGVITPIPGGSNTSTIQRVFLFGTGIAGAQLAIQYGQTFYSSLSNALNAVGSGTFIPNPDYQGIGIIIGYIVATKSATNLSDPTQAVFVNAGKFAVP